MTPGAGAFPAGVGDIVFESALLLLHMKETQTRPASCSLLLAAISVRPCGIERRNGSSSGAERTNPAVR